MRGEQCSEALRRCGALVRRTGQMRWPTNIPGQRQTFLGLFGEIALPPFSAAN